MIAQGQAFRDTRRLALLSTQPNHPSYVGACKGFAHRLARHWAHPGDPRNHAACSSPEGRAHIAHLQKRPLAKHKAPYLMRRAKPFKTPGRLGQTTHQHPISSPIPTLRMPGKQRRRPVAQSLDHSSRNPPMTTARCTPSCAQSRHISPCLVSEVPELNAGHIPRYSESHRLNSTGAQDTAVGKRKWATKVFQATARGGSMVAHPMAQHRNGATRSALATGKLAYMTRKLHSTSDASQASDTTRCKPRESQLGRTEASCQSW